MTLWTIQSMDFFRPEYWSGEPFPSLGDLPIPVIKPRSPTLQADALPSEPPEKSKQSWALKNWCFWTVVLEKTLESPLDFKEIQPINPKKNQSWILIGRIDWSWNSNTLATWCEELTHWKRPWWWERLKAGEGDDRGKDGWTSSPT